jgi:O-antigen/teichoic acid export membrane protein
LKKNIIINSLTSISQILVSGVLLFFVYKYLVKNLGVQYIGVWSIILVSTGFLGIANLCLSDSVVRYVSKYLHYDDFEKINQIIQVALIAITCVTIFFSLLALPLIDKLLMYILNGNLSSEAVEIVPYSLLSFVLNSVSSIFQSIFVGFHRSDIRNGFLVFSNLIYLILIHYFVPVYGFLGLAYAQVSQAIIMIFFLPIFILFILIKKMILKILLNKNLLCQDLII